MKREKSQAVFVYLCLMFLPPSYAHGPDSSQAGQGVQVPDFSPPPVPEFMLRKPATPLTLEEMQRQADEAARRARAESEKRSPPVNPAVGAGAHGVHPARQAP